MGIAFDPVPGCVQVLFCGSTRQLCTIPFNTSHRKYTGNKCRDADNICERIWMKCIKLVSGE